MHKFKGKHSSHYLCEHGILMKRNCCWTSHQIILDDGPVERTFAEMENELQEFEGKILLGHPCMTLEETLERFPDNPGWGSAIQRMADLRCAVAGTEEVLRHGNY